MYADFKTDITIQDSKCAGGDGGVFYLENLNYLDFRQPVAGVTGKYLDMSVDHPNRGSFIYSKAVGVTLYMENMDVKCQINPPVYSTDLASYLTNMNQLPAYGGAVYVTDALLVKSQKNTYRHCYKTNSGGIFYIATKATETDQTKYTVF